MITNYSLHSHTYRCGHASGDIEDYIKFAVAKKFQIYGVSDHVFLPGVKEPLTRGDYSLLGEYIDGYNRVKKKYLSQIKMYLGFECEYSDVLKDYYRYLLKEKGFDYLICGQHFSYDENKNRHGYDFELEEYRNLYLSEISKAMESGLFLYIAHPDIFFMGATEINEPFKIMTKKIIDLAIKYNAVLELNNHGIYRDHNRNGKTFIDYPCEYFWKEVSKTNIRVVYGGDYHVPEEIFDHTLEEKADKLIKATNLKLADINEVYKEYQNQLKKIL